MLQPLAQTRVRVNRHSPASGSGADTVSAAPRDKKNGPVAAQPPYPARRK